jgi:hypothetical protein
MPCPNHRLLNVLEDCSLHASRVGLPDLRPVSRGRLAHARDLLSASFDTKDCVLACYSAAGFGREVRQEKGTRLALVTLDDVYSIGA